MAEFIVGNPLRKLARDRLWLRQLLWRLDFVVVWLLVRLAQLLPVDTASRLGDRVGSWIGPKLKAKTAIYRANMAVAFPEMTAAELDQLVVRAWGRSGRVLAEYPHLGTILSEEERLTIDIREPI